jgi:hypothetical protein
MKSITIRLDDSLFEWLTEQARLNHRSKNRQIGHLLELTQKLFGDKPLEMGRASADYSDRR